MRQAPVNRCSDPELMSAVARGDTEAFEAIFRRHRPQALGAALRITRHPALAEEVTQDVFVSLWHHARRYDARRGSVGTWLMRLVHNRSIDALRRGARHDRTVALDEHDADRWESGERTEEEVVRRDATRSARRLLGVLPAEQREVLELAYFEGLSQPEIAARVGAPLGTVKGRQRLALAKLRRSPVAA